MGNAGASTLFTQPPAVQGHQVAGGELPWQGTQDPHAQETHLGTAGGLQQWGMHVVLFWTVYSALCPIILCK